MSKSWIVPLLIILPMLGFLVGLSSSGPTKEDEVASVLKLPHREIKRITSPDKLVDALLIERETDSLSANGYMICLVPARKKFEITADLLEQQLFYANRLDGFDMAWKRNKLLEIRYNRARIFCFSNSHYMQDINPNFGYEVELQLVPGSVH